MGSVQGAVFENKNRFKEATGNPDYSRAKARKAELEAEYERTGKALKALSGGGPMGMTPEQVRATHEWKAAKHAADAAFAALRAFNSVYVHRYKQEIAQDRKHKEATVNKAQVKSWMKANVGAHVDKSTGEVNSTSLAEDAAGHFDKNNVGEWLDDSTHWVWDAAHEVSTMYERQNKKAAVPVAQRVMERFLAAADVVSANGFVTLLESLLRLDGRRVVVKNKSIGTYNMVSVTLINLPQGVGGAGGGAEAENNRLSFSIWGFDQQDPSAPAPDGKVKVEQTVSALPREYKLRSKTAPPSAIAKYLADFINKVVKEVAPKFTHTKMARSTGKNANDMATSAEKVLSRFEEGKPADPTEQMSPEDAAEWKRQHDKNKDKFKSASPTLAEQAVRSRFEEGKPADPTENMKPEDAAEWKEQHDKNKDQFKAATAKLPLYIRVALRSVTADQDKSAPEKVDDLFKTVKKDNPSYTASQAWATAWSIYCAHVNPGSDSCHQDEYLKSAADDDAEEQALVDTNEDWKPEHKRGDWNLLIYKYSATRWSYFLKNPVGGGSGSTAYPSARQAFAAGTNRVSWGSIPSKNPGKVWVVEYAWDIHAGDEGEYKVKKSYWWEIPADKRSL